MPVPKVTDKVDSATLGIAALDVLMPMHLMISPTGHILRAAPVVQKLRSGVTLEGQRFLEIFEFLRPRHNIDSFADLSAIVGDKLRLQFRTEPQTLLKGVLTPLPSHGGLLLNLGFGTSIAQAVADYALTNNDFAPTDLAIEMLYLMEAKNAVMQESRGQNERLQEAHRVAEEQATTDALTGLKNRRAMDDVLQNLATSGASFGLMHLDLDFFKEVNDTFGHAAGDHVLQQAAEILAEEIRENDAVARVGGDEFVLIFKRLVDQDQLMKIAARIVKRLEKPVNFGDIVAKISGSIGITTTDFYDIADADRMLSDADVALYASKEKGRACATFVTEGMLREAQ